MRQRADARDEVRGGRLCLHARRFDHPILPGGRPNGSPCNRLAALAATARLVIDVSFTGDIYGAGAGHEVVVAMLATRSLARPGLTEPVVAHNPTLLSPWLGQVIELIVRSAGVSTSWRIELDVVISWPARSVAWPWIVIIAVVEPGNVFLPGLNIAEVPGIEGPINRRVHRVVIFEELARQIGHREST